MRASNSKDEEKTGLSLRNGDLESIQTIQDVVDIVHERL